MQKKIKTVCFKGETDKEARKYISSLPAESYNEGDKAEVTFPDGRKQIYVLEMIWVKEI